MNKKTLHVFSYLFTLKCLVKSLPPKDRLSLFMSKEPSQPELSETAPEEELGYSLLNDNVELVIQYLANNTNM